MKDNKITVAHVLFPVSLVAFVLCISLAFQFSEIMRVREQLHQAKIQQDKPLEEANRVQAQLTALALGANKLAQDGDKDAQGLIDRMKKAGITFEGPQNGAPTAAPANGSEGTATPSTTDSSKP